MVQMVRIDHGTNSPCVVRWYEQSMVQIMVHGTNSPTMVRIVQATNSHGTPMPRANINKTSAHTSWAVER